MLVSILYASGQHYLFDTTDLRQTDAHTFVSTASDGPAAGTIELEPGDELSIKEGGHTYVIHAADVEPVTPDLFDVSAGRITIQPHLPVAQNATTDGVRSAIEDALVNAVPQLSDLLSGGDVRLYAASSASNHVLSSYYDEVDGSPVFLLAARC